MSNILNFLYRGTGRFAPAVALSAALIGGVGAIPVLAHDGNPGSYQSSTSIIRRAAFNGYRMGYDHGIEDRRAGEDFNFQHDSEYRQATTGYTSGVGSMRDYQNAFRQAYARGYSDGYNGRGRDDDFDTAPDSHDDDDGHHSDDSGYGYGTDVVRIAATNGYRSGFEHGIADRRQRASFNYQHDEEYRRATAGFPSSRGRWGLAQYQTAFRQAYVRGYSDGYYGRGTGGDGYGISLSDVRRLAVVKGYNEGFEHGFEDRNARVGFDYQHDDIYRQATSGYDRRWNMLREYQGAFRQGYVKGYTDAFYGRNRNRTYDDRQTQWFGYRFGNR